MKMEDKKMKIEQITEKDIEREMLKQEGITGSLSEGYIGKISRLQKDFEKYLETEELDNVQGSKRAKALFNYLNRNGERQYHEPSSSLHKVLDNLEEKGQTGSCLGATLLYSVLAKRNKLDISIEHGNGHYRNCLKTKSGTIPIEHTNSEGFNRDSFSQWQFNSYSLDNLPVFSAMAVANECQLQGDFENAKERALDTRGKLKGFESPQISLGNMAFFEGDLDTALKHYKEAVSTNPQSANAYFGRGLVKYCLSKEGFVEDISVCVDCGSPSYSSDRINELMQHMKDNYDCDIKGYLSVLKGTEGE